VTRSRGKMKVSYTYGDGDGDSDGIASIQSATHVFICVAIMAYIASLKPSKSLYYGFKPIV
jgi:hypothetical protein